MAYSYFYYSSEQEKFLTGIEAGMGRQFRPGVVFTRGTKKNFTEKTYKKFSNYSDAKIVAEGDDTQMRFIQPMGV